MDSTATINPLVNKNDGKDINKIVFFDFEDWEEPFIKGSLDKYEVELCAETLSSANVERYKGADVISVFIKSRVTKEVLEKFGNLKLVATRSTGYDHIDIGYCKEQKIDVANVPSYGENTVAEHAMMLLLALMKRLPEAEERVKQNSFTPEGLTGRDIKGRTIGIIGTGHIGQYMVRYARGFGMNVLAHDKFPAKDLSKELGFEYVELDELFANSDVISLHVPYNDVTRHMINRKAIEKMRDDVVLINTARGGLVETDALFDALRSGKVGGAGLDVLEEESFLSEELELLHSDRHEGVDFKVALENHMMAYLPNVIITPHNAFNTKEALERIITATIDNILCYSQGSYSNLIKK